ncbi:odorant receptor 46a-like [Pieris rapae]|uniref:odorant receptor 46a-like n=1 Tax=Pieris rapae TaxID=64459 RepID=UPI001E27AE72|nr:odorant receptor 46a-like [Pieris rapae]
MGDIIHCFQINEKFWNILGIHPKPNNKLHLIYSAVFVIFFIIIYDFLFSINFYFMPNQLDLFIEELILYFTTIGVVSKVLTFVCMRAKITQLLSILKSDLFQPENEEEYHILCEANKFNITYWRIVAVVSFTSNITHVTSPLLLHLIFGAPLSPPVCSYSFIPENTTHTLIYPIYFYQSIGIHFHMLNNVNIDTFILGLMILVMAQLDILAVKLKNVTNMPSAINHDRSQCTDAEGNLILKLNSSLERYNDVAKFCELTEEVFSVSLFVQFSIASAVICVCLFRFTLPSTWQYYIFLGTYIFIMIIQILVPSWFGTRIMDKSCFLSHAIYSSDWTHQSRAYKRNMRIFVERASRPLSITGLRMFPMSLSTFTSIMNSAYSFFTLLRNME